MMNLYDLLTKPAPGTIMTWRTRYALNLKNLPYQIVDVEALSKKIGAAPTSAKPDGVSTFYTMPIVKTTLLALSSPTLPL
ncbi:uncharacterized protein ARMOST_02281 [Armillaria ostoyae]|uniref:GST N-terminal domain-containing protein n=1 Tax=Armillaria ostoyae TaxID=47428 RepID=A0A284QRA0_ARMOS|nr:uncharacterized protein ARMOST_02281 [Armillaria ostoyae]